ncbi:MAG: oxidoreductase [Solirubrobacterales bacterium]|nr:oxidoreductase [Solirubrobacterales bacterium]
MGRMPRVPILWRVATVHEVAEETPHARTIVLDVAGWPGHLAGQHVDVRLTAEDGYQAQRSYSIASGPEESRLALTVERIDDGEVSPYLAGELRAGDRFELRGPIGGHFTWRVEDGGPLLLVAGGSGLVPLMAMLRHRAARQSDTEARLLVSARSWEDVLYRDELSQFTDGRNGARTHYTLTRSSPAGWEGWDRRVDMRMLTDVGPPAAQRPRIYVCGPTVFVERVADLLVELGHEPATIRAERFGPTGG